MPQQTIATQTLTSSSPPQPQYSFLRGYKKKSSQLTKTHLLRTKKVKQKQQKVLRYDNSAQVDLPDYQNQQLNVKKQLQQQERLSRMTHRRAKSQFQIIKAKPMEKITKLKRNLSSQDEHQLMINTARGDDFMRKSQNGSQDKIIKFYSKNLQERMNEYLNLVVAKSSHDHQQKLKKLKQEEFRHLNDSKHFREKDAKIYLKNKFLRQLKVRSSLNKKTDQNQQFFAHSNHHKSSSLNSTRQTPNLIYFKKNSNLQTTEEKDSENLIQLASQMLSKSMRVHRQKANQINGKSKQNINQSMMVHLNR